MNNPTLQAKLDFRAAMAQFVPCYGQPNYTPFAATKNRRAYPASKAKRKG